MAFISELSLFTLKTAILVTAIITVLLVIFYLNSARRSRNQHELDIEELNTRFRSFQRQMQSVLLGKKDLKRLLKDDKKERKLKDKSVINEEKPRLFVIDFHGDIRASATHSLREEITAILSIAHAGDEALVRLESGGGLVTSYGLAASQLSRLKTSGVKLTIAVDRIAASGGYMMACVADRILAAPFAVIGSIGVVAQVPNFHRLLKRHDIDYQEVTAGEFKRTVSVFGEITEPGLQKFKTQIEETHTLFKSFVIKNRPAIDLARVATGEYWYGTQSVDLGLIDEVQTSDEYLFQRYESHKIYRIAYGGRKTLMEKITDSVSRVASKVFLKGVSELESSRF